MKIVLYDLRVSGHHLKYALTLIENLAKKGYEILYITGPGIKKRDEFEKLNSIIEIKVYKHTGKNKFLYYYFKIRNLIKAMKDANKWGADIFHLLYFDYNEVPFFIQFLISSLNFKKNDFKVLATLHWVHYLNNNKKRNIRYYWKKFNMYKSKTKIKSIPYPTDVFNKKVNRKEARKKLNLPAKLPLFLYFGGLRYDKGIDLLLDALKFTNKKFKLIIAGKEDYFSRKFINLIINKKNLKEKIIKKIKFIPNEEVGLYFQSIDAIILPYRNNFLGQSGPLLQACYARKPIIAFNSQIIGSIIKKYEIGLLAKNNSPEDLAYKIDYYLKNKKKLDEKFENNLYNYYLKNTKEKMVKKIEKIYKKIRR